MTLTDIRKYCRQVDLPVEISHLWQSLDTDSDGKVRMEELCSPRAEVLAKFKEWSRQKFGTATALWETPEAVRARARWRGQGLWISDTKMLVPAFGEALRELGWLGIHCQEERSFVFSSLDSMGCNLITPEDLAWLDRSEPYGLGRPQGDPRQDLPAPPARMAHPGQGQLQPHRLDRVPRRLPEGSLHRRHSRGLAYA